MTSPSRFPDITVSLPAPTARDLADNTNAIRAAFAHFRQARLRIDLKVYGPGTPEHPKSRYYFLLGTAPTLTCKTPEAVEEVLREIGEMLVRLNGRVVEERQEEQEK